jgi:hypothetical protein
MTQISLPFKYTEASFSKRELGRLAYIQLQKNKCYYCGEKLTEKPRKDVRNLWINKRLFPNSMFNYPIHLHHSRVTDLTIGAVHAHCSAGLYQYHGE